MRELPEPDLGFAHKSYSPKLVLAIQKQAYEDGLRDAGKDAEQFHEVMQCFKDMQLPHGLCMPRSRMACTNCNATDRFRELVNGYKGPKVVTASQKEQK